MYKFMCECAFAKYIYKLYRQYASTFVNSTVRISLEQLPDHKLSGMLRTTKLLRITNSNITNVYHCVHSVMTHFLQNDVKIKIHKVKKLRWAK